MAHLARRLKIEEHNSIDHSEKKRDDNSCEAGAGGYYPKSDKNSDRICFDVRKKSRYYLIVTYRRLLVAAMIGAVG